MTKSMVMYLQVRFLFQGRAKIAGQKMTSNVFLTDLDFQMEVINLVYRAV